MLITTGLVFVASPAAQALPASFQRQVVFSGLTNPSNIEFASDGRVFVAEKSGLIKVFDSLSDTTPSVYADLRTQVHNFWDRGLLGLALHPDFPADPRIYVLYSYDAVPGGTAPRWGSPDATADPCPTPPGPTGDGCLITGRLSTLTPSGTGGGIVETPLITDWCQQHPSHSVGDLVFGPDGMLYASGGDGASFNFADYGQDNLTGSDITPDNPCGDPPSPVGTALTPPAAEGGALRSQDPRTTGDPTALNGTTIRIDPDTGAAASGNPNAGSSDPNLARIVAYGQRNPFRITIRPGTGEVWAGEVGWNIYEEINRIPDPTGPVRNFGWPCYEGASRQGGYDNLNLTLCENLYAAGSSAHTPPYFAWSHNSRPAPNDPCPSGGSSSSGVAFYEGGNYPPGYDGALFFSDYSRSCVWVMTKGANGLPDPATIATFDSGIPAVELETGPGGDLFAVDYTNGRIVRYLYDNTPPDRGHRRQRHLGQRPAHGELHLDGLGRRRRRPGHVPLGPRRRRRLRRLHRGEPVAHLHPARLVRGQAAGGRRPRRPGRRDGDDQREQHGAGRRHHDPVGRRQVGGRRHGDVLRHRHRRPGRLDPRLPDVVAADPAPLPEHLPRARDHHLHRRERLVRRSRPRVPVAPGAQADRHGRARAHRHRERAAAAEDGRVDLPDRAGRAAAGLQRRADDRALHQDGDRRLAQLDLRAVAAERRRPVVHAGVLVGRRRGDAQRDRARHGGDVHGDLRGG
ncbi:hypothetical protein GCM10020001_051990 [Nonomuraea salmonea]